MEHKPNMTSLRTSENVIRYDINGRTYEFIVKELNDIVPFGYCYKLHKWALLYPDYIITMDGCITPAKRI